MWNPTINKFVIDIAHPPTVAPRIMWILQIVCVCLTSSRILINSATVFIKLISSPSLSVSGILSLFDSWWRKKGSGTLGFWGRISRIYGMQTSGVGVLLIRIGGGSLEKVRICSFAELTYKRNSTKLGWKINRKLPEGPIIMREGVPSNLAGWLAKPTDLQVMNLHNDRATWTK